MRFRFPYQQLPEHNTRTGLSQCGCSSCPSWDRTRTLLLQRQTCCQLHQGALRSLPRILHQITPGRDAYFIRHGSFGQPRAT